LDNGEDMIVEQILTGGDRNFAYIVADRNGGTAAIIDPSYDPEKVLSNAEKYEVKIKYLLNTHKHDDHTNGNAFIEHKLKIKALSFGDEDPESLSRIKDGKVLELGKLRIRVFHTPGHSDDSICYLVDNALFTGDTLFVGKVGGTDFEDGARSQYESLHNKILKLPDNTRVYPGHNVGVKPVSTIGLEKNNNPFLLQPDFESFVNLKKNWLQYKEEHDIA